MLNPFKYLRDMARAAVVNGVQDALYDVTPTEGESAPVASLEDLRNKLAAATATPLALPEAAEAEEPAPQDDAKPARGRKK